MKKPPTRREIFPHKKSIISQREVGVDTDSYEDALHNTLRQAPDVILIGEVRTEKTMEHALAFAETGHLCLTTLHANNANQALDRIINFFPEERHAQLLQDLSLNLRAFVSQRLIATVDKKRCAAIEILLNSPRVEELIKRGDVSEIKEVMEKSERIGMCTFDAALLELYRKGRITMEEALKNADSENYVHLVRRVYPRSAPDRPFVHRFNDAQLLSAAWHRLRPAYAGADHGDAVFSGLYCRGRSWWVAGNSQRPVRSRRIAWPNLREGSLVDYPAAGAEDLDPRNRQYIYRALQGHHSGADHRNARSAGRRPGVIV